MNFAQKIIQFNTFRKIKPDRRINYMLWFRKFSEKYPQLHDANFEKNGTRGSKIVIGLFKKITIETTNDEIKPDMKKIAKDYGSLSSDC